MRVFVWAGVTERQKRKMWNCEKNVAWENKGGVLTLAIRKYVALYIHV